jgi:hypothetical protein
MVFPPFASLVIAAGLMLFSLLVVNRAKKIALVGRRWEAVLAGLAALIFVAGLVLHLSTPLPPAATPVPAPVRAAPAANAKVRFSFTPKEVRWGEDVRIEVTPEAEKVTIYLDGKPLVHRVAGNGVFTVTVPSMSKSGRLAVEYGGRRVESGEKLTVLPR